MDDINLRSLFHDLQRNMAAALRVNNQIGHGPTKGTGTEAEWRTLLDTYLPKRYSVSEGIVIDSTGRASDAIDVVVYDRQYSPFILRRHEIRVIPAESVYAAFEVKQEITKANLEYAGNKVASVRRLRRTTVAIPHAGGTHDPVKPKPILGGILATTSGWTPPFGDAFKASLPHGDNRLDVGCAAADGGFEVQPNGEPIVWAGQDGLMRFFLATLRRLQVLGTVPALDIAAYEAAIGKED